MSKYMQSHSTVCTCGVGVYVGARIQVHTENLLEIWETNHSSSVDCMVDCVSFSPSS